MFDKILVTVDPTDVEITEKICRLANDLANKYQSEVDLLTVMPGFGMSIVASYFPEGAQDKLKTELQGQLTDLVDKYFDVEVKTILLQGKTAQEIVKYEKESGVDLIMIGCRKKQSFEDRQLLGSCSKSVSDRATCTVMIVR